MKRTIGIKLLIITTLLFTVYSYTIQESVSAAATISSTNSGVSTLENGLTLQPANEDEKQVKGTTQLPNTSVRISLNGATKIIIVTDENGAFVYKNSKLVSGDVVRAELKIDGAYTGAKEIVIAPVANKLTLRPAMEEQKQVEGITQVPKTTIRISVNGVAKTTMITDENGAFTYKNSKLVAGDVVRVELKIDGVYTAAKEVVINKLTLQPVFEKENQVQGTTQIPNTTIRISLNGVTKTTMITDENGAFTYKNSKLAVGDIIKIEMKIDGTYTGTKEVTVKEKIDTPTIELEKYYSKDTEIKGHTSLANNKIRISIDGTVKTVISSDGQGNFVYPMNGLYGGQTIEAALNVNGKYDVIATTRVISGYLLKGVYGTAQWEYESRFGRLTFLGGQFPESGIGQNIAAKMQSIHIYYDRYYYTTPTIQEIKFAEKTVGNPNSSYLFKGLGNLEKIEGLEHFDTSQVTDMTEMFAGRYSMASLDLNSLDTSKVTNMDSMFLGASDLTSLNLSKLDTSSVTNMNKMFSGMTNIANLNIADWNTSKVTTMSRMFENTKSLTSVDIGKWDTSSVTDMTYMFTSSIIKRNLNIDNWNTSKVTNMDSMFLGVRNLTSLNLTKWDTSSVTNMNKMFSGMEKLTTLNIADWDTSKVTTMNSMFEFNYLLPSLDIGKWDTSSMTDMTAMFSGAQNLNNLNIGNWDTSKVTTMRSMFSGARSLKSLDIGRWNTSAARDMSNMFCYTTSLETLDVSDWNVSKVSFMNGMFSYAESLTTLNLDKWNTSNVIQMGDLFSRMTNLTNLKISKWDTSNVRSMYGMFNGTSSLTNLDIGKWDTSDVTIMSYMFCKANSFKNLDISKWDTSKVESMSGMFSGASSLTNLDIGDWNTSKVESMSDMFSRATSLTNLDIGEWDIRAVTNMNYMFDGASGLISLNLSSWDTSNRIYRSQYKLFSGTTNLEKIQIGPKFSLRINEVSLPEKSDAPYTGRWILETNPKIAYASSLQFTQTYDGSNPGAYVREKVQ